jgi:hypothetical protein
MVVLNQSAETAEDTRSYVNAWDLLDEAVAISKRVADYAPAGRAASTAQESDKTRCSVGCRCCWPGTFRSCRRVARPVRGSWTS